MPPIQRRMSAAPHASARRVASLRFCQLPNLFARARCLPTPLAPRSHRHSVSHPLACVYLLCAVTVARHPSAAPALPPAPGRPDHRRRGGCGGWVHGPVDRIPPHPPGPCTAGRGAGGEALWLRSQRPQRGLGQRRVRVGGSRVLGPFLQVFQATCCCAWLLCHPFAFCTPPPTNPSGMPSQMKPSSRPKGPRRW
jgi:hypothetical protein